MAEWKECRIAIRREFTFNFLRPLKDINLCLVLIMSSSLAASPVTQGCCRASVGLGRLLGSRINILEIKSYKKKNRTKTKKTKIEKFKV